VSRDVVDATGQWRADRDVVAVVVVAHEPGGEGVGAVADGFS